MDQYFIELKQRLRVSEQQKQDIISELKQHLAERVYALQLTGLSESAAHQQAISELDVPTNVAKNYNGSYHLISPLQILAHMTLVYIGTSILGNLTMVLFVKFFSTSSTIDSMSRLSMVVTLVKMLLIGYAYYRLSSKTGLRDLNWWAKLVCMGLLVTYATFVQIGVSLLFVPLEQFPVPTELVAQQVSFLATRNLVILLLAQGIASVRNYHFATIR